jgi:hypothetical protein
MIPTETTPGQRSDAPASLDPPRSEWLPITTGDRAPAGEAAPKHGWPASIFILLSNLAAFGLGFGAIVAAAGAPFAFFRGDGDAGMIALLAVVLGLGFVVQRALAQNVKHFTRWGWYGAMAELAFVTLSKVNVLLTDPESSGAAVVGIVIDLLWMRYFWERRGDFDVDLGA